MVIVEAAAEAAVHVVGVGAVQDTCPLRAVLADPSDDPAQLKHPFHVPVDNLNGAYPVAHEPILLTIVAAASDTEQEVI